MNLNLNPSTWDKGALVSRGRGRTKQGWWYGRELLIALPMSLLLPFPTQHAPPPHCSNSISLEWKTAMISLFCLAKVIREGAV